MNTIDILNKHISLCLNIRAKSYHTITLFEALNSIRIGKYQKQIENIRRLRLERDTDSLKFTAKKKQLSSFVFAGTLFDSRFKFDICGYTSLMILDIDKPDSIDEVKELLKKDSHIIATWISPSGEGLKALVYLEYDKQDSIADIWIYHEYCAFPQISKYFLKKYNVTLDQTGRDITRLCFVSYDPDIHMKNEFKPFKVLCNLSDKKIDSIRHKYYRRNKVDNALHEHIMLSKLLADSSKLKCE